MIKTLTLTNFRRHENLTVDFTHGLSVLRGVNEAGKTSITEAISYALFGARADKRRPLLRRTGKAGAYLVGRQLVEALGQNLTPSVAKAVRPGAMLA